MKKKSARMRPLRRVAESREQLAATELCRAQQQLQVQLDRLKEMENYQTEYFTLFRQSGQGGIPIDKLRGFRSFLDKLETAVRQQKQIVKTAGEQVEELRRQWFSSRDKVKIFDNAISRLAGREQELEEKQEQKESDDRAQR